MSFRTTKERIIYESLRLFSEKGYDGVSMREIAAAVEIKAASLYAHFEGSYLSGDCGHDEAALQ